MERFTQLFETLDRTTRTQAKVAALEAYIRAAPPEDAAWGLWFLAGNRIRRPVPVALMKRWVAEAAELPLWLVDESHEAVGDLGETLALLLPPPSTPDPPRLARLVVERLQALAGAPEETQRQLMIRTWSQLEPTQRFLWHKMIGGGFRVGVSMALLVRALANVAAVDPAVMSHRLSGRWQPTAEGLAGLLSKEGPADDPARPFPFYLSSPREGPLEELGNPGHWQIEWKWDGIRAQLIRRAGRTVLWSRGEEIVTASFPEVAEASGGLPDGTVLDGEILAWRGEGPLPFARLQRRLQRRAPGHALCREVPVIFMAYDLLEQDGTDIRGLPLRERRVRLERVLAEFSAGGRGGGGAGRVREAWVQGDLFGVDPTEEHSGPVLRLSAILPAETWERVSVLREQARGLGAEGVMLKDRESTYGVGRVRGAWWKWKLSPMTCDAVLVAAQPGHGRRASLFTDYTFAVWRGTELVTVAKAYSGLSDAEIAEVDAYVRGHTTGRFGPVRSVEPELVFELAFDGVAASGRHRGGVALRFPRMARWRRDKKPSEADTLETLIRLAGEAGVP